MLPPCSPGCHRQEGDAARGLASVSPSALLPTAGFQPQPFQPVFCFQCRGTALPAAAEAGSVFSGRWTSARSATARSAPCPARDLGQVAPRPGRAAERSAGATSPSGLGSGSPRISPRLFTANPAASSALPGAIGSANACADGSPCPLWRGGGCAAPGCGGCAVPEAEEPVPAGCCRRWSMRLAGAGRREPELCAETLWRGAPARPSERGAVPRGTLPGTSAPTSPLGGCPCPPGVAGVPLRCHSPPARLLTMSLVTEREEQIPQVPPQSRALPLTPGLCPGSLQVSAPPPFPAQQTLPSSSFQSHIPCLSSTSSSRPPSAPSFPQTVPG